MFSILNVHWLKEQEYSQLFFSIFIRCIFSSKKLVTVYIHNNVTYMYMCVCVCVCVCICIYVYQNIWTDPEMRFMCHVYTLNNFKSKTKDPSSHFLLTATTLKFHTLELEKNQ